MRPLTWVIQANRRDQMLRQQIETALDSLEDHQTPRRSTTVIDAGARCTEALAT